MQSEAVLDKMEIAQLIAKVLTFIADALESAVSSPRTPAANDPVEAPAPAASDKPAPSATEMEEAPASAALVLGGDDGPDASDPQLEPRRAIGLGALALWSFEYAWEARGDERPVGRQVARNMKMRTLEFHCRADRTPAGGGRAEPPGRQLRQLELPSRNQYMDAAGGASIAAASLGLGTSLVASSNRRTYQAD